ncbi:MAG: FtsX-like permease family protein [Bacteroidales bacterium]|jgi:putative ABC transport system permease protein|nr:FtsX-like permease family protein [Bacteroidales bacterium]
MLAIKLAYRNLMGAGLRTWLNVFVLSFIYVLIIWHYGILDGWNKQAAIDMKAWEVGNGQYWQKNYDPYDFFTLEESHAKIPKELQKATSEGIVSPILITQGTIYPDGRLKSLLLKGIDPNQKVTAIPSAELNIELEEIPVIIGRRMADACKLQKGDITTVRWRDVNKTFDAAEVKIVKVFNCNVPNIDAGQMYFNIEKLQEMMQEPNEATMFVIGQNFEMNKNVTGWEYKDYDFLMAEMKELMKMKKVGGSFIYVILILLAMLAIFDTQVLSIFRRQKEIGTYIAMGMTRSQVVGLFTVEGAMHAVLAVIIGAIYGFPFLLWQMNLGFSLPSGTDDLGITIAKTIYPVYGLGLILSTVLLVLIITTIVSYIPASKISKMKPTEALKGKIQ